MGSGAWCRISFILIKKVSDSKKTVRSIAEYTIQHCSSQDCILIVITAILTLEYLTLAASSGKRNVTVWRPSSCLSFPSAYSPWLTMRRGQRTFRPDNKEGWHTCLLSALQMFSLYFSNSTDYSVAYSNSGFRTSTVVEYLSSKSQILHNIR